MDKQENEKIYRRKRITLLVIPLCVFFAGVVLRFGLVLYDPSLGTMAAPAAFGIFSRLESLVSLACIVLIIIYFVQRSKSCKECKAWNSMKRVAVELTDVKATAIRKTEQVITTHHDNYGFESGHSTTEMPYYVPGEKRSYLDTYRCTCCGYVERRSRTHTVEN